MIDHSQGSVGQVPAPHITNLEQSVISHERYLERINVDSSLSREDHVRHDAEMVRGIRIPRLDVEHAVFMDIPVSTSKDLVEIAEPNSVKMIGRERRWPAADCGGRQQARFLKQSAAGCAWRSVADQEPSA